MAAARVAAARVAAAMATEVRAAAAMEAARAAAAMAAAAMARPLICQRHPGDKDSGRTVFGSAKNVADASKNLGS